MNKTLNTIIGLVLFLGLVVWLVLLGKPTADIPVTDPVVENNITVISTQICLPHKNTDGPQTLECAMGIKDSTSGEYYALDLSSFSELDSNQYGMDEEIIVTGIFVPLEALSDDHWQIYDMKGIVRVTNIQAVNGEGLAVRTYIEENIGILAHVAPVLGGSWHVVGIEINQDENTARVVYEDGHVQSVMYVTYVYDENNKSVTITDVKTE